ncbi:histone acetyltransferase p300-like isoform X1 [Fukomys damarensis]|uniref:histone acetyltransferase p300-like isoform X1 n=1 Tax=Fukomys damarensis TaxID=885580 RepID=UPI00053FE24E|nr:histone acetyltransferase p300-like isoform X1 [Fukomys damarensis]XP_033622095.1 histone acetyltransferase p300-like isoform X1 [Fukomys damarensis]
MTDQWSNTSSLEHGYVPGFGPGRCDPTHTTHCVSASLIKPPLRTLRSPGSPLQQQQVLSVQPPAVGCRIQLCHKTAGFKSTNSNPQPLTGQPGMVQGQPGLQPPAMPGQQGGVLSSPAMQNMSPMQAGVQRAGLAQHQPQPQLQPPMGGMSPQAQPMNMNHGSMSSQFRDMLRQQQMMRQQQQQIQHHMQQMQQGNMGQMGQPPPRPWEQRQEPVYRPISSDSSSSRWGPLLSPAPRAPSSTCFQTRPSPRTSKAIPSSLSV